MIFFARFAICVRCCLFGLKACTEETIAEAEYSFAVVESKEKQCGICMENVLEKHKVRDRRFGLLENCAHVFCLKCIRKWRAERVYDKDVVR